MIPHWMIQVVYVGVTWVLPIFLGIRIGRRMPAMARGPYIKAFILLVAIVVLLRAIQMNAAAIIPAQPRLTDWLSPAFPFVNYHACRRLVQRLADAGHSPALAWFSLVPLGNVVIDLVACFLPQRQTGPLARGLKWGRRSGV